MKFVEFLVENKSTATNSVSVKIEYFEDNESEATFTFADDQSDVIKKVINDLQDKIDFFKPANKTFKFSFSNDSEFNKVVRKLKDEGFSKFDCKDKRSKKLLNEGAENKFDPEFDKSYKKADDGTVKAVKAAISVKEVNNLIVKDIARSQIDMVFLRNTVHLYGTHRDGDHIIALFKYVYEFKNEDFDEEDEDSQEENYSIGIAAINLNTGKLIAGGGEDGRDTYDFDDEAVEYLEKQCKEF